MDVNFELYKIFYHAAKLQSFSQAAKRLYITQSAVSQAIKNLENQLGGQLFFRKSRKVTLTWEGEMLFKHIEQAYNFIKTAEVKFQEIKSFDVGQIRVGVSDTICKYFLIPCLEKFNTQYPNIKIQVINRTSSQITELLKNGSIDIGIVTLPVNSQNIIVKEYITVEDIFVASDKFSALKDVHVSLQTLCSYPILMLERNSTTRKNFDKFLEQKGIQIIPEIELENVDLLVEFARIGLGISHVLKESAQNEIECGNLFPVNVTDKLPSRKIGICTINEVPLSLSAEAFIRCLQQNS